MFTCYLDVLMASCRQFFSYSHMLLPSTVYLSRRNTTPCPPSHTHSDRGFDLLASYNKVHPPHMHPYLSIE